MSLFGPLGRAVRVNTTGRQDSITNFSFTAFPNLPPTLRANRTKRRNSIINFSFTTFPFSFRGGTKSCPRLQIRPPHDSNLFEVELCSVIRESNRTLVVPLSDRGCVRGHCGVVEARLPRIADSS
jgi:hypothetical protein